MNVRAKRSLPLIVILLLSWFASACNGGDEGAIVTPIPTITLRPATLTPPPPTATARATPKPTATPDVTETPVIPSACPPPGDPTPPSRPDAFDDYAAVLAEYLSQGGSAQGLESLLRDWEAIRQDAGAVRALDLSGDRDAEIVVALVDPQPEFDLPWPAGDLLIFQCQAGGVVPVYRGRTADDAVPADANFSLQKIEDVNGTGLADVVYTTTTCGAHTCFERLYIVEWDGTGFVNRIPALVDQPYPTFTLEEGRLLVQAGGIGSVGAGVQRGHSEVWTWNGQTFTQTETLVGPPLILAHYLHDGDELLAQGDYAGAIEAYQQAIDDKTLDSGLFSSSEAEGKAIVRAYARFKLMVAHAAAGDEARAEDYYNLLLQEHPEGTAGYPYVALAQAFRLAYARYGDPVGACEAAVAVAQNDPTPADILYAGYGNPNYVPADLCRLPEE